MKDDHSESGDGVMNHDLRAVLQGVRELATRESLMHGEGIGQCMPFAEATGNERRTRRSANE